MSSMNPTNPLPPVTAAPRKPRADGVASRHAILTAAARLATTRGFEGLSIGDLAQHIGMSKSGLYAHFKSKEELELATIETAAEIFEDDVIRKVPESSAGLARVHALTEAFLAHLERRVFPGGCFFATVAAQLAAQPGQPRDKLLQMHAIWAGLFARALRQACEMGELPRDADIDQLVFEITAMMFRANFVWIMTDDAGFLDKARKGVTNVLDRAAQKTTKNRGRNRRKRTK